MKRPVLVVRALDRAARGASAPSPSSSRPAAAIGDARPRVGGRPRRRSTPGSSSSPTPYGDGHAGERTAAAIAALVDLSRR